MADASASMLKERFQNFGRSGAAEFGGGGGGVSSTMNFSDAAAKPASSAAATCLKGGAKFLGLAPKTWLIIAVVVVIALGAGYWLYQKFVKPWLERRSGGQSSHVTGPSKRRLPPSGNAATQAAVAHRRRLDPQSKTGSGGGGSSVHASPSSAGSSADSDAQHANDDGSTNLPVSPEDVANAASDI